MVRLLDITSTSDDTKSFGDILLKTLKYGKIFVQFLSKLIYDSVETAAFPDPSRSIR